VYLECEKVNTSTDLTGESAITWLLERPKVRLIYNIIMQFK